MYSCTCTLNINKLIQKWIQYLIFHCVRLYSKKTSKGPNAQASIWFLRFSSRPRAEVRTQCSPGAGERTAWNPAVFICNCYCLFVFLVSQSNIALLKPTNQSSTLWPYPASNAVDGNRGTSISKCTHTLEDNSPWWRVDLGGVEPVAEVNILNRGDCCGARLNGAEIRVGR